MKAKLIAILVIAFLALIVVFQNSRETVFYFLFWSARTSQIFVVVVMLLFGFVLGFLTGKLTGRSKT